LYPLECEGKSGVLLLHEVHAAVAPFAQGADDNEVILEDDGTPQRVVGRPDLLPVLCQAGTLQNLR
jgi:hypothetical protein